MGAKRIAQLNSLVQREVAALLARQIEFPVGAMVTVSRVMVADDAESAKVWLSILPATFKTEVIQIITANIRDIQSALNKKLVMKFVPKLTFLVDRTEERAARINTVLDTLQRPTHHSP